MGNLALLAHKREKVSHSFLWVVLLATTTCSACPAAVCRLVPKAAAFSAFLAPSPASLHGTLPPALSSPPLPLSDTSESTSWSSSASSSSHSSSCSLASLLSTSGSSSVSSSSSSSSFSSSDASTAEAASASARSASISAFGSSESSVSSSSSSSFFCFFMLGSASVSPSLLRFDSLRCC